MNGLLPPEYVNDSVESYFFQNRQSPTVIYWLLTAVVLTVLVSLPLVYVDVSISASGSVRPLTEVTQLTAPVAEPVTGIFVKEGDAVRKGDTLVTFCNEGSLQQLRHQQSLTDDYAAHISDLQVLLNGGQPASFRSPAIAGEYALYHSKAEELRVALGQSRRDYERSKTLYDKGLISAQEYETALLAVRSKEESLRSLREGQMSTWRTALENYRNRHSESRAAVSQYDEGLEHLVLTSPVDGTVERLNGVYPGSSLQAGTVIALISPRSSLVVDCLVSPRDIGFLRNGQEVNLQVTAFNYHEWGMLHGHITYISSDFLQDDNGNCFFKVRCSLDKPFLTYRNGSRQGFIRKGMSVTAHFVVTRRSLFELLYQHVDTWMNPTQYQEGGRG